MSKLKKGLKVVVSPLVYVGFVVHDVAANTINCAADLISPVISFDDAHLRDIPKDLLRVAGSVVTAGQKTKKLLSNRNRLNTREASFQDSTDDYAIAQDVIARRPHFIISYGGGLMSIDNGSSVEPFSALDQSYFRHLIM